MTVLCLRLLIRSFMSIKPLPRIHLDWPTSHFPVHSGLIYKSWKVCKSFLYLNYMMLMPRIGFVTFKIIKMYVCIFLNLFTLHFLILVLISTNLILFMLFIELNVTITYTFQKSCLYWKTKHQTKIYIIPHPNIFTPPQNFWLPCTLLHDRSSKTNFQVCTV